MKLMTYNIQDGGGEDFGDIVNIIKREAPDYVTINEANGFNDSGFRRLKVLSQEIDLSHFRLAMSGESNYHVAVLSRYPLKSVKEAHPLKRAGIVAIIETEIGNISVAGVHLAPNTEDTRLNEVDIIISDQDRYDLRVIMGDLNSLSGNDGYDPKRLAEFIGAKLKRNPDIEEPRYDVVSRVEQAGYIDTAVLFKRQGECTVPITYDGDVLFRNLRLDYIFVSEPLRNKVLSYKVAADKLTERSSDHFPVIIELNT